MTSEDKEPTPLRIDDLPAGWLGHMRDTYGWNDEAIIELTMDWYGDKPPHDMLKLHETVFNGEQAWCSHVPGYHDTVEVGLGSDGKPFGDHGDCVVTAAYVWLVENCKGPWCWYANYQGERYEPACYVYEVAFQDEADYRAFNARGAA